MPTKKPGAALRTGLALTLALGLTPTAPVALATEVEGSAISATESQTPPLEDFEVSVATEEVTVEPASMASARDGGETTDEKATEVAIIGSTSYTSLAAAFEAAKDSSVEITLIASVELESGIELPGNSSAVLDLNGCEVTLKAPEAEDANKPDYAIRVPEGSSLTVRDTSSSKSGSIEASCRLGVLVALGNLSIESGSIINEGGQTVQSAGQSATFSMSGGSIIGALPLIGLNGAELEMTGGTVSGSSVAVYLQKASFEMSGGKVESTNSLAIQMNGATATVSGNAALSGVCGVILFNDPYSAEGSDGKYGNETNSTPSSFEMTGGSIECDYFAVSGNNLRSALSEVSISGGSLTATEDTCIYWPMEGTLSISGGTLKGSTVIEAKMGTIEITGGVLEAYGAYGTNYTNGGTSDDGSAIKLVGQIYGGSTNQFINSPNLTANITGGTIKSDHGSAVSVYNVGNTAIYGNDKKTLQCDVTVTNDVSMNTAEGVDSIRVNSLKDEITVDSSEGAISAGGTTVNNAELADAAAIAQRVTTLANSNTPYTSYELFSSLDSAIRNAGTAEEGGTAEVKLLKNVEEDVTVPEGSNIKLDLNGNKLTGDIEGNNSLTLAGSGTVVGNIEGLSDVSSVPEGIKQVVAYVGETGFSTLEAALGAASATGATNKTVTLAADQSLTQAVAKDVTLVVPGNQTLSVDRSQLNALLGSEGKIQVATGGAIAVDGATMIGEGGNIELSKGTIDLSVSGGTSDPRISIGLNGTTAEVPGYWTTTMQGVPMDVTIDDSSTLTVSGTGQSGNGAFHVAKDSKVENNGRIIVESSMSVSSTGQVTGNGSIAVEDDGVLSMKASASEGSTGVVKNATSNAGTVVYEGKDAGELGRITLRSGGEVYSNADIATSLVNYRALSGKTFEGVEYAYAWRYSAPYVPPVTPTYSSTVEQAEGGSLALSPTSAKAGATVTVTVTPDAGKELSALTVLDKDGNAVEVTANADGTYSFKMPAGGATVSATFICDGGNLCVSHPFADVDTDAWYHLPLDWAVENGVLHGYADSGLMKPEASVSRAELAAILYNVEGATPGDAGLLAAYSDVDADAWYQAPLSWAVGKGLLKGYEGTDLMRPDGAVTREEAAAVLMRWAEMNGEDTTERADLSGFADPDGVSDWAVEVMQWAVAADVLRGVDREDGSKALNAQGETQRAEAAALLMRLVVGEE